MPLLQSKTQTYNSGRSRLPSLLILLAWLAVLWLAFAHKQNIYDWFRLRNYRAPAAISELATQDTMTDQARHVFYVNHPELLSKSNFFKACPSGSEQTIVLGCYHSGQTGIFLQDVSDPRLNGVEQVTAAHEMLHAAYDRLSSSEKSRVNKLLQDYYNNQLTDQRVKDTINAYKKTEPNDLLNEMHSIFGTEIGSLPQPLEDYYKRYFTNRSQVAAFAAQYQSEFTSRQARVAQYDAQLSALKSQIDSLQTDLKSKQAEIGSRQRELTALRGSNPQAYNAGVPGFNALVDAYNSEVAQLRNLISQYNALVTERNAVAFEENELIKSLSNQQSTIDSQVVN